MCCIKTCKYFILATKENSRTEIWKETALIELRLFFIETLAFQYACLGVEDLVSCFRPQGPEFALKSCPQGGDFDGKN